MARLITLLLLSLLALVPVQVFAQPELGEESVADEAVAILENEELPLEQRRELLKAIVNRHSAVGEAWAAYGEVVYRLGDQELAMASFRKAIEIDPSLYSPWLWIGILEKRGTPRPNLAAAEASFRAALERGAPRARTLNELAVTLAMGNRYEEALAAWRQALQADPEWGVLYNNLIKGALALGDEKMARQYVTGAINAERFEENAVLLFGEHLAAQKRTKDAAALYRQAIDRHPLNPRMRYYLGVSLGELGDKEGAIDQLLAAKRLSTRQKDGGDLPQATDWMIFKLEHPKDEEKFQEARRLVFDQQPTEKSLKRAIERVTPLIERHPEFWNGYFVRAVAQRRLNAPQSALADLNRVLELAPSEPNATMEMALLWRDQFEFARAAEYAEQALALAPRDPVFKVNAAFIMIDADRCDRAWELYGETIKLVGGENEVTTVVREELEVRCARP